MPSLNVIAFIFFEILQVKCSQVIDAQLDYQVIAQTHRLGSTISKFANVAYEFANNKSPLRHFVGSAVSEIGTLFHLTSGLK